MLEEIRIRDLGVITEATLPLATGLTVLTGETGAGKTMVLTGLGLLLGGRADPGAVRGGAERADVQGRVRVDPDGAAARRAGEAGAELDEDVLTLGRRVSAEGRSRAHLGGQGVPAAVLAELAQHLVAVHGQHDQQRLLQTGHQRTALDRFAGPEHLQTLEAFGAGAGELRAVRAERAALVEAAAERHRELEVLRTGLAEVERVAPQTGEDVALRAESERLSHADGLRRSAGTAHDLLTAEDTDRGVDAATLLQQAQQVLEGEREHDEAVAGLADRVQELSYLAADLATDLASYAAGVETDPSRLDTVHRRRAELTALVRVHGESVEDVLAWAQRAGERLLELDGTDERIAELAERAAALELRLAEAAEGITAARRSAAAAFAAAVGTELSGLAMPHARIEVQIEQRPDPDGLPIGDQRLAFAAHGTDDVEIRFAPHEAAATRPLGRGASGGELSRLMLAVEVVLAASDPVPTFVFDEVDAGVGGRAAVEVGHRLARLARTAQVVVVTHLPQVAAFADQHLTVVKSDDGSVASSGVLALDDAGRVRELSRMLAGLEDSETAQAHAAELLATAAAAREQPRPVG